MGGVTVKPAGMQVVWDDGGGVFGSFRTFNMKAGMQVAIILDSDGPSFIDVVERECKVTIGGAEGRCRYFGQQSQLSKDGKHLRLEIEAEGAKLVDEKAAMNGEIAVLMASEKAEASTGMLDLKVGTVVEFPAEAGLPKLTIEKVGKPSWGKEEFMVSLKCHEDFQKPVSVKFIDENGKEQVAKSAGSSRMGIGKMLTVSMAYKVDKKVSKAKLVVEYWKDLKKVTVPVDFKLGFGGPE